MVLCLWEACKRFPCDTPHYVPQQDLTDVLGGVRGSIVVKLYFPLTKSRRTWFFHRPAALRLFPNLFVPLPLPPPRALVPPPLPLPAPFIRLAENPRMSAVDAASLLFAKRFLPPNPNFWSFFCRLDAGPEPRSRPCRSVLGPSSTSMFSKRSSASFTRPVSWPFRSRSQTEFVSTSVPFRKLQAHYKPRKK